MFLFTLFLFVGACISFFLYACIIGKQFEQETISINEEVKSE